MEHEDSFGILFFANFCTSSNKLQTMDVGKGHSWTYKGVFVKDSSDCMPDSRLMNLHIRSHLPPLPFLSFIPQTPNASLVSYTPFTFCSAGPATMQQSLLLVSLHLIRLNTYFHIRILKCPPFLPMTLSPSESSVTVSHCPHCQELLTGLSRLPPTLPVASPRVLMHPPCPCTHGTGNIDEVFPWWYLTRDSCQGYTMF